MTNETRDDSLSNRTEDSTDAALHFPSQLLTTYERSHGGIVLHAALAIYACYALSLICLNYFVPALYLLTKYLNMPRDIAGATFMAFGSAAPGLFLSIIGTFMTGDDLGFSEILGSSVFDICALVGICSLLIKQALNMDSWPITRDCFFYTLSILLLTIALWDSKVYWYESLVLLVAYVIYIVVLCYDKSVKSFLLRSLTHLSKLCLTSEDADDTVTGRNAASVPGMQMTENMVVGVTITELGGHEEKQIQKQTPPIEPTAEVSTDHIKSNDVPSTNSDNPHLHEHGPCESFDEGLLSWTMPKNSIIWQFLWALTLPITLLCSICILDCRQKKWRNFFVATFVASIICIGALTYLLSWMIEVIQATLKIAEEPMGYTVLAFGTSLPDLICSLAVARQGYGNMALANGFGTNIIDILVNLSLPWLIQGALPTSPTFVTIPTESTFYVLAYLVASTFVVYGMLVGYSFQLNRTVGTVSLILYVIFVIGSVLLYQL